MVVLGRKTCEGKKRGGGGDPQSLSGATAWTVVGASSMRATRRSWVVCGAWDLGRMGGGGDGSGQLGRGRRAWASGLGSAQRNSIFCKLFKNIQRSLNQFDPMVDFPCSKNFNKICN
jgi:hypothetical protein